MPPFLAAILAKLLPFLTVPVLAGGLLLSTGGLGVTWWHLHQANGTIAERDKTVSSLTNDLAAARLLTAQTQRALSDFHAQVEMDRADANAKALASEKALQAQITTLSSKAAQADKARRASSDALLKALHNVPQEQQAGLSPAVRDALRRVRDLQANPTSADSPASGGGANNQPVPAAPVTRSPDMP